MDVLWSYTVAFWNWLSADIWRGPVAAAFLIIVIYWLRDRVRHARCKRFEFATGKPPSLTNSEWNKEAISEADDEITSTGESLNQKRDQLLKQLEEVNDELASNRRRQKILPRVAREWGVSL